VTENVDEGGNPIEDEWHGDDEDMKRAAKVLKEMIVNV